MLDSGWTSRSAVKTFSLQEVTQTLGVIILEEELEGLLSIMAVANDSGWLENWAFGEELTVCSKALRQE